MFEKSSLPHDPREARSGQAQRFWIPVLLVLVLSAALRIHGIDTDSLWLDEGYSWWDARQSWSDIWTVVPNCDPHPSLYFALLKLWIGVFGDGTVALRSVSALAGVAATLMVALAAREVTPRAGWLAALLFAIAPFQLEFAHEARPYGLYCLAGAVLAFGCLRVARLMPSAATAVSPGPQRAEVMRGWLALFLGAAVLLWTNNTAILMVASLGTAFALLLIIERRARPAIWPFVVLLVAIIAAWVPYLPVLFEQVQEVSSDFWIVRPLGWRIANELRFLFSAAAFDAVWWAVALTAGGLLLMLRQGARRQAIVLATMIFLPIALNWSISMVVKPIYLARAFIAVAPFIVVAQAAAIVLLPGKAVRRIALALLVTAQLAGIFLWHTTYLGKEQWRAIAQKIARDAGPGGLANAVVLVVPNELVLPLGHAFEETGIGAPVRGLPADFPAAGLAARYPSGKCAPSLEGRDLGFIRSLIAGHQRVFFVTRKNNTYDPGNRVVPYLTSIGLHELRPQLYVPGYLELHEFDQRVPVPTYSPETGTPRAGSR